MAMRFIVPRFPVPRSPHAPYPSLDDAVLLEESLLLLGEGVDELGVLLVRHELRHQALRAVPFLELGEIGRAHVELQSLMRISYAVFCLKKKSYQNKHKVRLHRYKDK